MPDTESYWLYLLIGYYRGLAQNWIVAANRGKTLGWKPKYNESILDAVYDMLAVAQV